MISKYSMQYSWGEEYPDDLLHLLRFLGVQPVDTSVFHNVMGDKEPSDSKNWNISQSKLKEKNS